MDELQVTHLCHTAQLGEPLAAPQMIAGGLLHRMWRLTTTRGSFAVKQLNVAIMRKTGIRDEYDLSEQIAARMAEGGVPAIVALAIAGQYVQKVDESSFLIYPWIEGEILATTAVEPARACTIGAVLGRIHTLDLHVPALHVPVWEAIPDDDWDMLTFHAADLEVPWAGSVRAALSEIAAWNTWVEASDRRLAQTLVVSHRDLDQKNVLWRAKEHPMLIDWEAAGLINPSMELLGTALAWSGQMGGRPREDTFNALLDGYRSAGGVVHDAGIDALHGVMGNWLGWLVFNMRRSLGETTSSEDEQALGVREVFTTLSTLRALAAHSETWAGWLDREGGEHGDGAGGGHGDRPIPFR